MHPAGPPSLPVHDAESPLSPESNRVPHKFDPARAVPGPALLPGDIFDPLKPAAEPDVFWNYTDQMFQPLNSEHAVLLRGITDVPLGGFADADLQIPALGERVAKDAHPRTEVVRKAGVGSKSLASKSVASKSVASKSLASKTVPSKSRKDGGVGAVPAPNPIAGNVATNAADPSATQIVPASFEQLEEDSLQACLNAFPITQRLVAAFLDEGGGSSATPAPPPLTGRAARSGAEDTMGPGSGTPAQRRKQQEILELRVKQELRDVGLFSDPSADDELQTRMRQDQWRLRDVRATNRNRHKALIKGAILPELKQQPLRREGKRHNDMVEMAYLERMISRLKKNKKSRSKFQKLLTRSRAHYKEADRKQQQVATTAKSVDQTPEVPARSKGKAAAASSRKKKRKSEGNVGPSAKRVATAKKTGQKDAARQA